MGVEGMYRIESGERLANDMVKYLMVCEDPGIQKTIVMSIKAASQLPFDAIVRIDSISAVNVPLPQWATRIP